MAIEVGTAYISILPSTDKLTAGIKAALRDAETEADRSGRRMGSGIGSGLKKAVGAAGGIAAAVGFGALVKEAGSAADAIDKFKQTMSFAGLDTKTIEKATKATQDYANKTVYGLGDIQSMTAQLAANGIKNYTQITEAAGNLNAVAGGNAETFKSVGMVMTQTAGAGKLTTENWNQLADAIPGASGQIQKSLEKNGAFTGNFREAMAKGQVTADEFNKSIVELGSKPVAVKAASSTKTFEGALGNLQASVVTALIPAMERLQPIVSSLAGWLSSKAVPAITAFVSVAAAKAKPVLETLGNTLKSVAGFVRENTDLFVALGAGLAAAGISLVAYNTYVKVTTAVTKAWSVVQRLLNGTLRANPIGIAVTAIGLLVAALVLAYKKSDTFRNIVNRAWAGIKNAIKTAWDGYIKPALNAMWGFIQNQLMPVIRRLWNGVVKPVFNVMKRVIGVVIKAIIGYFKLWWAFLKNVVFPILKFLWNSVVKPVMAGIGKVIKGAWDKVIKPVFSALGNFINDKVRPAFRKGVDAIGSIWNGLKAAARKPVEFLVNTVYNNGIRAMMNKIPGVNLPSASFATGGWTGQGGKYTPAGIVHADEYVINKAARRKIEGKQPGLLDYMNNYGKVPGYASGGRVWPLPGGTASTYKNHDGVDLNAPNDLGKPYLAAAGGTVSSTGYGRGYGNAVFVRGSYGELVYGHSLDGSISVSPGQSVYPGMVLGRVGSTGNSTGPHLHFGFPGGSYEGAMAFLRGAAHTSGVSAAAIKKEEGTKDRWWDVVTDVPSLAKGVWNDIKGMGSSGWFGQFKKAGTAFLDRAVTYGDGKIPDKVGLKYLPDVNLPDTPIRSALKAIGVFDNGGVLEPGKWAYNASNKPEAVFNHKQFQTFADRAGKTNDRPRRMAMTITNWEDGIGFFEEVASDQIDSELAYQTSMGRRR